MKKTISFAPPTLTMVVTMGFALGLSMALSACNTNAAASSESPDQGSTALTVQDATRNDIQILKAGPAHVAQQLTLYGVVALNAYQTREIRARYPGIVRSVTHKPGQAVAKGTPLLSIESSRSLATYTVRAPIDGIVLERKVNPGEAVDTSRRLMVIADLRKLWVQFQVFARDLGRVRAGQAVRVSSAYGSAPAMATLDYVAPAGDAHSQSVMARATLDNRNGRWVPGQFVTGAVTVAEIEAEVSVVPQALQQLSGETVVFAVSGKHFVSTPVEVGLRDAQYVEIRTGLAAGTRYAGANSYLIKADARKDEGGED